MDCTQRLWDLIRSQRVGPRFALDLSPKLRQTVNPWGKAGQHRSNAEQTHAMRRQTGSMAQGRQRLECIGMLPQSARARSKDLGAAF